MGEFWTELGIGLSMLLLPLLFPYRADKSFRKFTPQEIQLLKPELNRYNYISVLVFVPVMMGCLYLVTDLLMRMLYLLPNSHGLQYAFAFSEVYLLWPGIALGFVLSVYIIVPILQRIFKNKFELLSEAGNQQYGINGQSFTKGIIRFSLISGLLILFVYYDWYTGVRGQEFIMNPLYDVREKRYLIGEITTISYVDYYKITPKDTFNLPYFEIIFKDGYAWNSSQGPFYMKAIKNKQILQYLSGQTGLAMDTIQRYQQTE